MLKGIYERQIDFTKTPGKPKVGQFNDSVFCEENIFRFDISMKKIVKVAMIQTLKRLPYDALRCRHRDPENL